MTLGIIGILSDCLRFFTVVLADFAYPIQRSFGISADESSDQPLVPAQFQNLW